MEEVREKERQVWKKREREKEEAAEVVKGFFIRRGIPEKYGLTADEVLGVLQDVDKALEDLRAKKYGYRPTPLY